MIRDLVVSLFDEALARGAAAGKWPALATSFTVEPPRDPKHGDFAVNAAMVLARPAKRTPRELAEAIVDEVRAGEGASDLASIDIAGPGFINVRLTQDVWLRALAEVERRGDAFGRTD